MAGKSNTGWLFGALAVGVAAVLTVTERRRALRSRSSDAGERAVTNLTLAVLTTATTQVAMSPLVEPVAAWVERRHVGLVRRQWVPRWMRDALAVILLDYTLYWWHVVEHKVSWLYRFHQVHHADLDLDTTTAFRFHFGEFLASVPWRVAQVLAIGASPRALAIWQRLTILSVLFHHSNARLPIVLERRLSRYIVTPRLHGIHHSIVREEQNSNWSSGLALWDHLHRTFRGNVPQAEITIGVPALRRPEDVTLPKSLAMPFAGEPPPWQLPDGTTPRRETTFVPRGRLL